MLENFYNTLLAYCSKRTAFRLAYICVNVLCLLLHECSDSAYRTWIQLAILDHNAHLDCSPKLHSESHAYSITGITKNRQDVVQVMQAKDYKYIPELLKEIFLQ